MKRRVVLFALGCAGTAAAAAALKPRRRAAEVLPPIDLESQIPKTFGDWKLDTSIVPVLPDPAVQAKLDQIYTQVLARTYANGAGRRVMLSIAYGADQGSDATAVHRPEFCYSAQGFVVRSVGEAPLRLDAHELTTKRLIATLGQRFEPITYWVTLNDRALLPGVERKLEQIRLGLTGLIPDGLLMRTSTVGMQAAGSFALQSEFLGLLATAMPQALRSRYFGRPAE